MIASLRTRLSIRILALLTLCWGSLALAADTTGAAVAGFFSGLLTTEVVGGIVAGVLAVAGGLLAKVITTSIRRRNVAIAIRHAYAAVEEIARLDERTNALDKVSTGLGEVDKWMRANGWRPLTEQEKQVAKLGFTGISGAEHAAVKAATASHVAAALALEGLPVRPQSPRAS